MDDILVVEYKAAYVAANPGKPEPVIQYRHGRYQISYGRHGGTTPYRKKQVAEMRDRLRERAERFGVG